MMKDGEKKKRIGKALLYVGGLAAVSGLTYIIVDRKVVMPLKAEIFFKDLAIKDLQSRSLEKDWHFKRLMSDGLRAGSSLAGEYMAGRKTYLRETAA